MSKQEFNPDTYFGAYEELIREAVGKNLDEFKKSLGDIENDCLVKLLNIECGKEGLSKQELLDCSSEKRCQVLSALLYRDAFWRLEVAYLMVSIGLLNIAYANLRESSEALANAFIVRRLDEQAKNLLHGKKVNQKLIKEFLPEDFGNRLLELKEIFNKMGVHTYLESLQLNSLFAPDIQNKRGYEMRGTGRPNRLADGFVEASSECIEHGKQLAIIFMFLFNKPLPD